MSSSSKRTLELSVKRRAVLEALLREQGIGAANAERIPRREEGGPAPLSFAQQRLWFLNQLEPDSPLYNIHAAVSLSGPLNVPVLRRSMGEILRRHEALRTTFAVVDDRPVQIINEAAGFKLPVSDMQELDEGARWSSVSVRAEEEAHRPFDLTKGPLLRANLLRLGEAEHVLLLTIHHIVSDGWSIGGFVRELAALYEAYMTGRPSPLPALPIQYADFAAWQREWLQGDVLEEQLSYWKRQLADVPPLLELPTDRPRPPVQSYRGAHEALLLSESLSRSLKELSRREGATLFMTLLAAFSTLLHRYTNQEDILVGTPIANRNRSETESLIGFFVNTLVLRARVTDGVSFRELLRQIRETSLEAYAHQDLPFEKLVEELQPERALSHSPIFQMMLDLQNAPMRDMQLQGLRLTPLPFDSRMAKFDLTLTAGEEDGRLSGLLEYNTDLFDAATVVRMAGHFERLLEAAVSNPDEQVSRLRLLTEAERDRVLFEWNDTRRDYGKDSPIHLAFAEQAERTPEAVAIRFEQDGLTYRELNERANQIGRYLRELGVGPEVLVGILLERSTEMLVGLLGVLKAGGAYVPLDPTSPAGRLSLFIQDAGLSVVLTRQSLKESVPACDAKLICMDADWKAIAQESVENLEGGVSVENLAYIVYTSGSTGRPKGVLVEHRQLSNYVRAVRERLALDACESFAMVQPLTVDSCVTAIYPPLLAGGCLHLISEERAADAQTLASYFREHQIDCLKIAPSHLAALHQASEPSELMPRERLIIGGEASRRDWGEQLRELARCSVFNHYGPTETTVGVTTYQLDESLDDVRGVTLPIGKPLPNVRAYVLDQHMQPVPQGVAGDLYIGGKCVARGYLDRPELTAAAFRPDPFGEDAGARLYRTGDLARYLADGQIEFLGRRDHQVKVRGFRIELGEIETALREHEGVRDCVVAARDGAQGDAYLTAYVVATQGRAPTGGELRAFLKEKLPEYMLPSVYLTLDKLPLTPHGKVDRRALPQPEGAARESDAPFVAPRNAVEEVLAEIFAEVLGVERVGAGDNFFELGGHSLLATQVASRVRKAFQPDLPLRKIFEAPTVGALAEFLTACEPSPGHLERTAETLRRIEGLSADDLEELLRRKRAKEAR